MTVNISKPAYNLREELEKLDANDRRMAERQPFYQHLYTGDGSTTEFACTKGKKPFAVFSDGLLKKEVTHYTATFDGFVWTVTFLTAPGAVSISIWEMDA